MREWALFVSVFGSGVVLGIAFLVLKGTILDITNPRETPWGILWYLSLVWVLLPLLVVSYLGINNIPILYVAEPGLEFPVALVTVLTLILYVLSLGLFLRLFGLSRRKGAVVVPPDSVSFHRKATRLCIFLSLLGLLLLVGFYVLDYKHALLTSFVKGTSILRVRLANKYYSRVPTQLASMLPIIGYLLAILSGYIGRWNLRRSLVYLLIALLVLTAPGDKALPIYGVILYVLAWGRILPRRLFSLQTFKFISLMIGVSLTLTYFVASRQIPQLSIEKFKDYLVNRLGIGQMAGTYDTFGLMEKNYPLTGNFYWHMIPFASFFADYVDYQKYLMMVTEGYGFTEMGVKNTYFIAEAWAIGGVWLALLSPIVVGFTTSLGLYLLRKFFKLAFGNGLASMALPIYLMTHNITGGFSGFPFLKGLIFLLLQLGVIWLIWLAMSLPWQTASIARIKAPVNKSKDL